MIGGCGEGELDAGDGHASFADRSRATFNRAGSNIARRKNMGQAGLERARLAFALFPRGRIHHGGSGFDESSIVAFDFRS